MIPALNDLRVVETASLILHEAHDEARLARVRAGVREEAVQRNPVIAARYGDRFFVLDGAHRVRALSELGCDLALAQLVPLPESAASWAHLLPASGLESALRSIPSIEVTGNRPESSCLAQAHLPNGAHFFIRAVKVGLVQEVRALRELQTLYPAGDVVRRVDPETATATGEDEALLSYRRFVPTELVEVVEQGEVLPAGITRFVVSERVLNVRYPLDLLANGNPERRNRELREFVESSWLKGRVRRYTEPVVLFE